MILIGRDDAVCLHDLALFVIGIVVEEDSAGHLDNPHAAAGPGLDLQRFFLQAGAHPSLAAPAEGLPADRVHRFLGPEELERALRDHLHPGERPLVLTDGVVPGTGELPPLGVYWEAVRELDGRLLVDDSHGLAVVGATGKGSPEAAGLPAGSFLQTGTFSKGFGAYGGLVAGLLCIGVANRIFRKSWPPVTRSCRTLCVSDPIFHHFEECVL